MSWKGQELEVLDILNENSVLPSAGVTYYAESLNNVKDWIFSTWCILGQYMGPDLLVWLRLDDGKLLLLLIQVKCYLKGNIGMLVLKDTSKAIQSLNTDTSNQSVTGHLFSPGLLTYFQKVESAKDETLSMPAAINMPDECFTRVQYNILQVVAVCIPLIDSE